MTRIPEESFNTSQLAIFVPQEGTRIFVSISRVTRESDRSTLLLKRMVVNELAQIALEKLATDFINSLENSTHLSPDQQTESDNLLSERNYKLYMPEETRAQIGTEQPVSVEFEGTKYEDVQVISVAKKDWDKVIQLIGQFFVVVPPSPIPVTVVMARSENAIPSSVVTPEVRFSRAARHAAATTAGQPTTKKNSAAEEIRRQDEDASRKRAQDKRRQAQKERRQAAVADQRAKAEQAAEIWAEEVLG